MSSAVNWRSVLAEVEGAGLCARPVRLRGITLDRSTGELAEGTILVACKDRRAAVCPTCSRLYQADAWQLVAAGIRGGKGVDPTVAEHPQLFVTFTAPSFGPVHRCGDRQGRSVPCRPRRSAALCPHGAPLSCMRRHSEDDPLVGEPLCARCFDYRGAVLWNAHVPRLWDRTVLRLYLEVAGERGLSDRELRSQIRLSYMKVVEFQRRGLVHLHVVLRADGAEGPADPPPVWLDAALMARAVHAAARSAGVAVPAVSGTRLERATWGRELDVRALVPSTPGDATAIAAYVAKYATKTADGTPGLAHPVRSAAKLERLGVRPHVTELVKTAWWLGSLNNLASLGLRAHAHTFGYRGQFSSKSRGFSTTFTELRAARARFARGQPDAEPEFDAEWRFAGRGYDHPEAEDLVVSLTEASRKVPHRFPRTSPKSSRPC